MTDLAFTPTAELAREIAWPYTPVEPAPLTA
jgi:hypothetical protein